MTQILSQKWLNPTKNILQIPRNLTLSIGFTESAVGYHPATKHMKIKTLVVITGILALTGISYAEEGKKPKKEISPELLEKYDADKDGKLSKEELAEMKKAKAAEAAEKKKTKEPKEPKEAEGEKAE